MALIVSIKKKKEKSISQNGDNKRPFSISISLLRQF